MAAEAKRGCGYRKIGGLYLVGNGIGVPCDRLPLELIECPCCHRAFSKQGRGWQWVNVAELAQGPHRIEVHDEKALTTNGTVTVLCKEAHSQSCTFCAAPELMGEAGLIWIGEQYYKTPGEFIAEGVSQGFSRRVATVPRGFKPGQTYVLLAHSKAIRKMVPVKTENALVPVEEVKYAPGVFYIWRPQRIEKICVESQRGTEEMTALEKRGIHPVFVPDNDPDHQPRKASSEAPLHGPEGEPLFEEEEI